MGVASAADLANGLLDALEDLGILNLPVRIRIPADVTTHWDHLVVVGLNLVLADGSLGRYLELEVEVERV